MRHLDDALRLAISRADEKPMLGSAHGELAFVYLAIGELEAAAGEEQRAGELEWKISDEERTVVSIDA